MTALTVLGGGNTAFSVAANLTLSGAAVTLCELPTFEHTIAPIVDSRKIALDGVAGQGTARLATVTTDFESALAENELALLIAPAYGHRAFAEACAPHLSSGQSVVLMPGTLGSLEFAHVLRQAGAPDGIAIGEVDTAPYVCRKLTPTSAHIWGVVEGLGLGVWPASEGERVHRLVEPFFPGLSLYPNVFACGLASMNPVVHPAGVLLNAGRIEYSRGEFYFYEEGVTPGVCRVIYAVDAERIALGRALGVDVLPVDEAFHRAGFGPRGDLWATINGSRMLTQLRAPGILENRWLTEDAPYGIATWSLIGEELGTPCPTMRSLVDLNGTMLGKDLWASARTPADLGIAGMDAAARTAYVERGEL